MLRRLFHVCLENECFDSLGLSLGDSLLMMNFFGYVREKC
jgi:hypothetical protein